VLTGNVKPESRAAGSLKAFWTETTGKPARWDADGFAGFPLRTEEIDRQVS